MNQLHRTSETSPSWQQSLADLITDPSVLLKLLQLDPSQVGLDLAQPLAFPLRVPREYVLRMKVGDPKDPLLLQVLPCKEELVVLPGYTQDPLQEKEANKIPGLLHKYRGRVLLTITGACAIHCRYCFRQHFSYEENNPGRAGWNKIVDYVAADPSINEIIFSGGDPLFNKDAVLSQITEPFKKLSQIKRLRFHTRLPVVIPQRITAEFIEMLKATKLQIILVIHANHPNEIDAALSQSLKNCRDAGFTVLNQSVLLKGINDDPKILASLSEKLFESGCFPYYLHTLDKVAGAAHFDLSLDRAREIVWQLSQILPGFLVPKLVKEVPGMGSKVPIKISAIA